mgnify:CR=1 FL=1
MKKVTSLTIKPEHIKAINMYMGHEDIGTDPVLFSLYAYAFYYNTICINRLDLCDADRYANLNTILGYDVGVQKFRSIDSWMSSHNFDLMNLSGSQKDRERLQQYIKETKTKELDFTKWKNMDGTFYFFSYYENGKRYE